jgi:hypothetical protein
MHDAVDENTVFSEPRRDPSRQSDFQHVTLFDVRGQGGWFRLWRSVGEIRE